MPKNRKGDPSGFSNTHSVVKYQKIEGEKFFIFGKISTMPKKLKGGTLWNLSTSILSQNSKKIEGGTLWGKKFPKQKSRGAEKKIERGPFALARYGMLRGKTGKTFLVRFARPNGAIIFCRTLKNYFGQFVWIEKKVTISRVSLHEAPTKNG